LSPAARAKTVFLALLLTGGAAVGRAGPASPECGGTVPAIDGIIAAFERHRVVLLGEQHQRREFHSFLEALIGDERFSRRVDDIVVEFGNARHQDVVDRYVAGEAVDPAGLARAWRDTTQILVWDSPLYASFFDTIRELNRSRVGGRKLRVLLGDPAIDWAAVTDAPSYGRFAERDRDFADVVDREVLAKGRRALVVIGGHHVMRTAASEPRSPHPGVGDLLAERHPGLTFAVFAVGQRLDAVGKKACHPTLLPATGRTGNGSFGALLEPGVRVQRVVSGKKEWVDLPLDNWPRVREKVDAVLYLGRSFTLVPPGSLAYVDAAYVKEIHRRARIISDFYGFDMTADLPPLR
jgi:Haem-binding uptake, Tiki superfamily, ChaN